MFWPPGHRTDPGAVVPEVGAGPGTRRDGVWNPSWRELRVRFLSGHIRVIFRLFQPLPQHQTIQRAFWQLGKQTPSPLSGEKKDLPSLCGPDANSPLQNRLCADTSRAGEFWGSWSSWGSLAGCGTYISPGGRARGAAAGCWGNASERGAGWVAASHKGGGWVWACASHCACVSWELCSDAAYLHVRLTVTGCRSFPTLHVFLWILPCRVFPL